ncbi:MAG: hypothetical protein JSS66_06550 [Armatimonadetes bacterium]|nr:hypothetical protein [Armatimonadota bacterium]
MDAELPLTGDLMRLVKSKLVSDSTLYEPTVGDHMLLYTSAGVYGPVPYEPHAYYWTFSVLSDTPVQPGASVHTLANQCVTLAMERIAAARKAVADAAGRSIDMTHVRVYDLRCKLSNGYVELVVDAGVSCFAKKPGHDNVLDTTLGECV